MLMIVVEVLRHSFEGGQLVLDSRFFPVVIATWSGRVNLEGVEAYYRWYDPILQRAADQGVRLQSITDGLDVDRLSTGVSAAFIENTNERIEVLKDHVDRVMLVARRPVILGLLAAVVHRLRWGVSMSSCGTMDQALERAKERLDATGIAQPAGFDPATYERPRLERAVA